MLTVILGFLSALLSAFIAIPAVKKALSKPLEESLQEIDHDAQSRETKENETGRPQT